jgi:hypothetical protein
MKEPWLREHYNFDLSKYSVFDSEKAWQDSPSINTELFSKPISISVLFKEAMDIILQTGMCDLLPKNEKEEINYSYHIPDVEKPGEIKRIHVGPSGPFGPVPSEKPNHERVPDFIFGEQGFPKLISRLRKMRVNANEYNLTKVIDQIAGGCAKLTGGRCNHILRCVANLCSGLLDMEAANLLELDHKQKNSLKTVINASILEDKQLKDFSGKEMPKNHNDEELMYLKEIRNVYRSTAEIFSEFKKNLEKNYSPDAPMKIGKYI